MTVLVADDLDVNRKLLRSLLSTEGYDVVDATNGLDAYTSLQNAATPKACRKARALRAQPLYLILLPVRDSKQDIVAGLQCGANDYITKPFDKTELLARVGIGKQMVQLQQALTERVAELREALVNVKQLGGLLPICSYCKKIRDDQNYWTQVESYVGKHSDAKSSHSICPQCYEDIIKPQMVQLGVDPNEPLPSAGKP